MKKLPEPPNWVTQYNLEGESLRLKNKIEKLSKKPMKEEIPTIGTKPKLGDIIETHNNEWQLCPKCNGEGELPDENNRYATAPRFYNCDLCNGKKIISKINGEPPQ